MPIRLEDISIRTELQGGDIGYVTYLHGSLYKKEFGYSIGFEAYVATGFYEFYNQYDPVKDFTWICEHENRIVGFLLLMHRMGNAAQLRYFILLPEYRGIGLGKKLMNLLLARLMDRHYTSCYLWTTNEQTAAATLYRKYGFKLVEEHDSTAFGKPLKEQRYILSLDSNTES